MALKQLENEDQIIADIKAGDSKAFDILIKHYEKYIWNIASRYTDLPEDTAEVVQDAILQIWLNMDKFREDSKFSTWIYVIIRNYSTNALKNRKRIPTHPYNQTVKTNSKESDKTNLNSEDHIDSVEEMGISNGCMYGIDGEDPESNLMAERLGEAVFDAAGEMNEDLAQAWYLREVELLTYDEISERLDIPLGTCKSRLFNAREVLSETLDKYVNRNGKNRFQV